MSLETPDRIRASATLLIQGYTDPPNGTIDFLANNGFASVEAGEGKLKAPRFADETLVTTNAIVLVMDDPVSNNEGEVDIGGDAGAGAGEAVGYITPSHYLQGIPLLDELTGDFAHQVVVSAYDPVGLSDVFRLTVSVMKKSAAGLTKELKEAIAGEPVAAPV